MAFEKGHVPWNKGRGKKGARKKREPKRKQTKKRRAALGLALAERHKLALRMLYGSEEIAHRMRGRKSLFREHMYGEGEKLAALGMTMEQIADFWNVHQRTLQRWAANREDFRHTIKKAKAEADLQVEGSLFKKAKGYEYTEQHFELRPAPVVEGQAVGEPQMKLVKTVTRHVAPDTAAIVFWLLNRQGARWKDKRQLEVPPGMKLPLEIILSDGNQSKRITAGDKDSHALPAPREGPAKP